MNKPISVCDIDGTLNNAWKNFTKSEEGVFTKEKFMSPTSLVGAVETLNWAEKDYEIIYLTSRGKWDPNGVITNAWLTKYGFPKGEVILVDDIEGKIPVLRLLQPKVVIDDFTEGQKDTKGEISLIFRADIAQQIENMGIEVIVAKGNWDEIRRKLEEF